MKKYISFSVLLCLCIGVVALLFWQFRDPAPANEVLGGTSDTDHLAAIATGDTTAQDTTVADTTLPSAPVLPEAPDPITLDLSGTMLSRYVTPLTLRLEWAAYRGAEDADVYISTELYLDGDGLSLPAAQSGYITVNGITTPFSAPEIALGENGSVRIGAASFKVEGEDRADRDIPVSVSFTVNALHGGVQYWEMTLSGFIRVTDEYGEMKESVSLEVVPRTETTLPSGSAVLSLATVLDYFAIPSDPELISDNHLEKMPAGFVSPEVANVGNPRNEFNSYGCYAPVLVAAAESYLDTLPFEGEVEDMTGCNPDALLLTLSEGYPAVVWMPADLEEGPTLAHTWIVDGKTVHMADIRCAVLCGYDLEAETVTLAFPGEEPTTLTLSRFEELFLRMGAQCVVIK